MRFNIILIFLFMATTAQAITQKEIYNEITERPSFDLIFNLSMTDFFGECTEEGLQKLDIGTYGMCAGNFFDPRLPDPTDIIKKFYPSNIQKVYDQLTFIKFKDDFPYVESFEPGKLINLPFDFIMFILYIFLQTILDSIKFFVLFIFSFAKVWLIYFLIGFNVILRYFDRETLFNEINNARNVIFLMTSATIVSLIFGWGWLG